MTRKQGRVIAVCLGPGGIPKHPVDRVFVDENGLAGDAQRHRLHGGVNRAVCLFSEEDCETLRRDGVPVEAPGTFGENLLIEGLAFADLQPGQRLGVGPEVVIEIHDVREPCVVLRTVDQRFPALMEGRSGFVCRVVESGHLEPGQTVTVL